MPFTPLMQYALLIIVGSVVALVALTSVYGAPRGRAALIAAYAALAFAEVGFALQFVAVWQATASVLNDPGAQSSDKQNCVVMAGVLSATWVALAIGVVAQFYPRSPSSTETDLPAGNDRLEVTRSTS